MAFNNMGVPFAGTFCPTYVAITGVTGAVSTFTATPVGTAAAISYCVRGKAYTKATITGGVSPTIDINTGLAMLPLAANRACIVVVALDATGALFGAQGNIVSLDGGGKFQTAAEFPLVPDNLAPFFYVTCVNGSTGTAWTFGTSLWNATGMVATATPVMMLPPRPATS